MGLDVGIAGAGIGGLAAAALLADRGHRVVVHDRWEAPQPLGSGLIVQPVGLAVLGAIGAEGAAWALGAPIRRLHGREVLRGRVVLDVSYGAEPALAMHRAALFSVLHKAVRARGIEIWSGAEVTGRRGRRLLFAGGRRSGPFDLLVDAAGARSPLSPLGGRPLAYGALWATVPWAGGLRDDQLTQRYRRADRMAGILPVGRLPGSPEPLAAVFWSLRADWHEDWRRAGVEAWKAEVLSLWPQVEDHLAPIRDAAALTFARYEHGALRVPVGEGLAHIGDAAHRASPQLGQGANMALLDALALAAALDRHPGLGGLSEALAAYAAARRWHVRAYQALSAAFTPQYQGDGAWLPLVRDHLLAPLTRVPPLPRVLSALVAGRLLSPFAGLSPDP